MNELTHVNDPELYLTLCVLLATYAETGDVDKTINHAYTFRLPRPENPEKPHLSHQHSLGDARVYLMALEQYEINKAEYYQLNAAYQTINKKINDIIMDFLWDISGLKYLPNTVKKDRVWSKAYEDGHSEGMYEVYLKLISLVDLFN